MSRGARGDLYVMSDSDQSEDEFESTYLLRHVQPITQKPSHSMFNIQTIPIGGHGQKVDTKSNRSAMLDIQDEGFTEISYDDIDASSEAFTSFIKNKADKNPVKLSDYEHKEDVKRKSKKIHENHGVPYRETDYPFTQKRDLPINDLCELKKRNIIVNLVLVGIVNLMQGVGFILVLPDVLFINIGNVETQTIALFVLLGMSVLSLLVASVFIRVAGPEWTIFIGTLGTILYSCARLFGEDPFVITAAAFAGVTYGLYTSALYTYIHNISLEYSQLNGRTYTAVLSVFSSFVLVWSQATPFISILLRYSFIPSETSRSFHDIETKTRCGVEFCWEPEFGISLFEGSFGENRSGSDQFLIEGLLGSFLVSVLGGTFLAWTNTGEKREVNQLYQLQEQSRSQGGQAVTSQNIRESLTHILETTACFCNRNLVFVLPLFLFAGCQQMFAYSVFVQTFTQCAEDLASSVLAITLLSATSAVFSLPVGLLIAAVGKVKVVLPALLAFFVLLVVMAMIEDIPVHHQYIMAVFWGIADCALSNVTIAICASFHMSTELVISCSRACQVLGYVTIALFTITSCNSTIIIFCLCLVTISSLMYVAMEIRLRLDAREELTNSKRYVPLQTEPSWLPHVNPVHVRRDRTSSLTPDAEPW